ncbi:phage tail protein [Stenotrophomonas sp. Sa5BUN4]|uniref:Phage tail protein n=1 Tax=Stenotrophomonas lacuserhaii TaxID=2760084 RepID=A0A8X8FQY6_9GAMM|nr:host specificity factor TipJ family phage tail protein [Stenotrophomonas pennii]MBD7952724.1 phage tail protein [Stenotrophomonas pennii]
MGLMDSPASSGRLIVTPHPVLVDGQRNQPADLLPGESLCTFLHRHVADLDAQDWVVLIGGKAVPRDMWPYVYPKHGQVIEARGAVGRSAVALVATLALTYFTFGIGNLATWGAGAALNGLGSAAAAGIYMAGSILINRVLQPKQPKAGAAAPTTYSIAAGRNRPRPYEPLGLLIGSMRIAPDVISNYYTHYEGDDQFLSFVLTPGLNVHSVEALYNGDALLASYDGVRVWHNGFPGMPSAEIPLYSNADVVDGGTLLDTSNDPKHQPSAWVQRTSSAGTIRLMVGVEFQIWDRSTKGKDKQNSDQIQIQYRAAGTANWQVFGNYNVRGTNNKSQRASYAIDVPEGQYDVRVRVAGNNTDGSGAEASFVWTTLTSVQRDTASYAGIPRIGIRMQANGQLNGAPDEIRCVAHSMPISVWTGSEWVTQRTSNPGAWILAYARGIYAPNGDLVAGMAMPERQIDIEGLKAFMLHCAANGFTYDNLITDVRNHQQVLDVLALAGFGQISWPRGRLSVGWAADEQPLSGVVNMATIKKGAFQVDYTLTNGADGIEYTYLDSTTWEAKTLRVPAPGVTTMLNPAQVTGEGVTTEAHAVMLARWHLAQSLYQYKAISYSTDIEHLSYSRMSMLALQHDMTQWGYGGRVRGATLSGGRVRLLLDEPVPAPAQGNAYVGVRIPGERVYRVLAVQPFAGTSASVVVDWPSDAHLPGTRFQRPNGTWEENPAWDTLWIYDFKQTPGLRVRVTSIRPESDLKGAAVEVVAESPQFWQYVKTGEYVRDPNESLLQTRPVASDLKITERQVVQGDTEYTELQASFAITGPVGDTVVLSDLDGNAALEEVARTVTRTATWRIPGAGTYPVTVRPYSPDGNAGVAASVIYTTRGADAPPVLVDIFDVEQLSGGVRRYTWGFFSGTIQSANFAGVEIRYIAGTHAAPAWDEMTPLGDDGYHASAFEAVLPPAGEWTFACRSRNTAGTLSTGMQVLAKTLPANLGEVIGGIEDSLEEQIQKQVEQQQQIDRDRADSIARDAAEAAERAAAFAQAQVNLVNESALRLADVQSVRDRVVAVAEDVAEEEAARIQAMLNAKLEWKADIAVETTARQSDVESLARQVSSVAAGSGTQFDSKQVWYFDTTVEGWTGNGTPTIVDGWLRPANQASNPHITSPAALAVDGAAYRFIKMRLQRVGTPTWRGLVQWITNADTTWNTAKSVTIPAPNFDANGMATFDVDNVPWNGASPIRQIRLSLASNQTATAYLLFDYIAIGRPTPGASVALVQQETLARQTADATEATQRNTLAVQLRGDYAGSDAAAAQGLIGQVNSARIEGDRIITERTSLIEGRLPAGNGQVASQAAVAAVDQASVDRDNANALSINNVKSGLDGVLRSFNAIPNGAFDVDTSSWAASGSGSSFSWDPLEKALRSGAGSIRVANTTPITINPGDAITVNFRTKSSEDITGTDSVTVGFIPSLGNPTGWVQSWSNWINAVGGAWGSRSYTWTVPSTFNPQQLYLRFAAGSIRPLTSAYVLIDDVVVQTPGSIGDLQTRVAANAQSTAALTTEVTNVKGQVTAQGAALTQTQQEVAGKASNAALQSLTGRVDVHDGQISAQGAAMTAVQSQLGNIGGDNLIGNSSWDVDAVGWSNSSTGQGAGLINQSLVDSALPNSTKAWRWNMSNWPVAGYREAISNSAVRVLRIEGGKKHTMSVYIRGTAGPRVFLQLRWYDAAGATIRYSSTPVGAPFVVTESWDRKVFVFDAPADAVSANTYIRIYGANTVDQWVELDNVQIQVGEVATGYAPSAGELSSGLAANAAATSGLSTKVTSLEGAVTAQGTSISNVQVDLAAANVNLDRALRSGSNMVVDGSFELRPVGTVIHSWAVSVAGGRTGANALQLSFASNVRSTQIQVFEVQPDRVYYCEAWVKRVGPAAGNIQLRFQLSDNGALQTYPNFQSLNLSSISETEWTKISGYVRVAAGKNRAVLQLNSAAATTSATQLLWDDFVLMDVTEAYNAQQTATAAAQATSTLDGKVTLIDGVVTAQGQAITTVSAAAGAADAKAGTAQAAAQAAADAAGAKGKVLYQSAAPAAADRLTQNLWIDTTGNANTPKRWNGSAWVAVTDKAATDAAAAAAAARSVADATASGLSATNAWVQAADGVLNAHTTQINQAQAAIAGKANASAVIELDAKVTANITGGGNLLTNASFSEAGRKPWGFLWNDNGFYQEIEKNYLDPGFWPKGMNSLGFRGPGFPPAGQSRFGLVANENVIAAQPGKRYIASVYLNGHRCATCCYLAFYDNAGNNVGEWTDPERVGYSLGGSPSLAEMPRQFVSQIAPPTTRTVRMGWRARAHADFGGDPYLWAVRPMLEQVPDNQTQPSPWSAGGSEDHASINLMTDVNGNVSGMQVKNSGTTSEINFLADVLNVLGSGGIDGFEMTKGRIRAWSGNFQAIIGAPFGPDGLMLYFGPNVGVGNASKAIATIWFDRFGNAYWGGAIAAGALKNAFQSTSIQTVGNSVTVGPFDTNGRNKNVVVSFQRNISRTKWAGGNTGFVVGGGSNYAVIQVFRQVEGQAETLWTQFTVGGDVNIFNQNDGSDSAESYWNGAYTLNDQADGTARRTYRAVVADYGERTVTHQSGSFDTQNVSQSLSLVSIEQ